MGKDYTKTTTQTAVVQNGKKTFSVEANLYSAAAHRFAEIIKDRKDGEGNGDMTSKIKFTINDFRNGKGEKQVFAYCNLTISEFSWLYKLFCDRRYDDLNKLYYIKSEDYYIIRNGKFAGLCRVKSMRISYTAGNNYPFKIGINNGYGKEGKITAGQLYAEYYLSEADMYYILKKTDMYINVFSIHIGATLIPEGLKKLDEENRKEPVRITNNQNKQTQYPQQPRQYPQQNGYNEIYYNVTTPDGKFVTLSESVLKNMGIPTAGLVPVSAPTASNSGNNVIQISDFTYDGRTECVS